MKHTFDAIVIGSGFGGAITACRLAEKGMKVLILERGRRWEAKDYPRKPTDAWLFDHRAPQRLNGWLDMRFFKNMTVAQAAGVGGGSLTYSSVALEANPALFKSGWPAEITLRRAEAVLRLGRAGDEPADPAGRPVDAAPETGSRGGAEASATPIGSRRCRWPCRFRRTGTTSSTIRSTAQHSKTFTNAQGQQQGTCVHLGNCDIGCDVHAKNTLDLNYMPMAEKHGAEVRPLHLVRAIEPMDGGYRVVFDRISDGRLIRGERDRARGCSWRREAWAPPNCCCDAATSTRRCRASAGCSARAGAPTRTCSRAPTPEPIASSSRSAQASRARIDFTDGSQNGERFVIEDDGFPNLILSCAARVSGRARRRRSRPAAARTDREARERRAGSAKRDGVAGRRDGRRRRSAVAQAAVFPAVGERPGPAVGAGALEGVFEAIHELHRKVTAATGGNLQEGLPRELPEEHGDAPPARRLQDWRLGRKRASSTIWARCSVIRTCTWSMARSRPPPPAATPRIRSPRWPSASRLT